MISEEFINQMSRKLNEIKSGLNSQIQDAVSTAMVEKVLPSIQATNQTTLSDPINRLAEVLVGMNNRPSAQTLMLCPVSTTTLTDV